MSKQILNEPVDVIENKLYQFSSSLMKILIKDNTTKGNLHWATSTYEKFGEWFAPEREMKIEQLVNANILTPRVSKSSEEQQARTKDKGEVFTPAWMCNMQANYLDEDWFGRKNVFNKEIENGWKTNKKKITFSKKLKKTWQEYVADIRMEITCGEAPYLVSRYDVVKGEVIPVIDRIGILDRKLRIVNENVDDEEEWLEQAEIAFKSTYGYDYQGDNVVIARENLLYTLIDNMVFKFGHQPSTDILKRFSTIISWNIWQMDGLDCTIPYSETNVQKGQIQLNLFEDEPEPIKKEKQLAKVKCWLTNKTIEFKELLGGKKMKFDYIIGNPPYQGDNHHQLYPDFYIESKKIADNVELIFPTGWQAPKNALNLQKMNTKEIKEDKQIVFINNVHDVFKNVVGASETNIIYWKKDFDNGYDGKQLIYTDGKNPEIKKLIYNKEDLLSNMPLIMQKIASKFTNDQENNLPSIICSGRSVLKFNDTFLDDYPESKDIRLKAIQVKQPYTTKLGPSEEYELKTSTFDVLDYVFIKEDPKDEANYYKLYGSSENKRTVRWINKKYMELRNQDRNNLNNYKVLISKAASAGDYGAKLSDAIIAYPNESCTSSFYGIGFFSTLTEAKNCEKYLKTKLFRALLGLLKTTRDNPAPVFGYIPIQNFTNKSDIDWSKTISEIDKQLYKKYKLSKEEIDFIEANVKEMI